MLTIEEITLWNFKGTSGTFRFERLNLLIGPNGSGKTAIALAPMFGITGHTPFGKRPADVAMMAGPDGCSVEIGVAGSTRSSDCRRSLRRKCGKNSLSVSPKQEVIDHCFGNFAPMFNLSAFLDLSSDKRRAEVMRLCAKAGGDRIDAAELRERIRQQFFRERGILDGDELDADTGACLTDILNDVADPIDDLPTAVMLIGEAFRAATNTAKRVWDEKQKAARECATQKARIFAPASSVSKLKEELATANTKRDGFRDQIAIAKERERERERLRDTIESLKSKVAGHEDFIASRRAEIDQLPTEDAIGAELQRAEEILAANPDPGQTAIEAAEKVADDAESLASELRTKADVALSAMRDTGDRRRVAERELERAQGDPWLKMSGLLDDLEGQQDEFTEDATETLFAMERLVQENSYSLDDLQLTLNTTILAHQKAESLHSTAMDALDEAVAEAADAKQKYMQAREAQRGALTAYQNAVNDAGLICTKAEQDRSRRAHVESRLQVAQEHLEKCESKIVEHEWRLNELEVEVPHTDQLQEALAAQDARICDITAQIKARSDYDALAATAATIRTESTAAESEHGLCKTLTVAVKVIRESLMVDLLAPLLGRMNSFLEVVIPGHTAYCELTTPSGTAIFELGWEHDGLRVPLDSLSGGETVIMSCALAYSLVMLADPPLKLLILEAAEVDNKHTIRLLHALEAVKDDVGNIIFATHMPVRQGINENWNVIEMDRAMVEIAE